MDSNENKKQKAATSAGCDFLREEAKRESEIMTKIVEKLNITPIENIIEEMDMPYKPGDTIYVVEEISNANNPKNVEQSAAPVASKCDGAAQEEELISYKFPMDARKYPKYSRKQLYHLLEGAERELVKHTNIYIKCFKTEKFPDYGADFIYYRKNFKQAYEECFRLRHEITMKKYKEGNKPFWGVIAPVEKLENLCDKIYRLFCEAGAKAHELFTSATNKEPFDEAALIEAEKKYFEADCAYHLVSQVLDIRAEFITDNLYKQRPVEEEFKHKWIRVDDGMNLQDFMRSQWPETNYDLPAWYNRRMTLTHYFP